MKISEIKQPEQIKQLSIAELNELAKEIRTFLIDSLSKTGGHLSSNLGVVELTIALHYVFDSPKDKIFFDVGHQSYVHKILTGRSKEFDTLRQFHGLSGFQKRKESVHDVWEAGHSSTALSAALGMAVARDLNHDDYAVVPVVGDASIVSGISVEALNHIGSERRNIVIIFNDNNMSISKNVGALNDVFTRLRTSNPYNEIKRDLSNVLSVSDTGKSILTAMKNVKNQVKKNLVPDTFFKEFNLDYIGPVDGHNLKDLIKTLSIAKKHQGPIIVHVITKKGKGYSFAENDISGKWHGVSPFHKETGKPLSVLPKGYASWSQIIADGVEELAKKNEEIVCITPAMISGSKLENFFANYPQRSFDCGIAEEHASIFAASLANCGKHPFLSIYSSFLQRAYDQMNHELARMDLPVVVGIDRSGLVGEDGPTHHGVFDVQLLRALPNFIVAQPKDADEALALLATAFESRHPFAIRYPRGSVKKSKFHCLPPVEVGSWTYFDTAETVKCIIITYGIEVSHLIDKGKNNQLPLRIVNARFFKPLDEKLLDELADLNLPMVVYETDMLAGGLGSAILEYYNDQHRQVVLERIGIGDHFVEHGGLPQLRKVEGLDLNRLCERIVQLCD